MELRDKLVHALIEYDRKQSTKPHHNIYAIGMYFEALDSAMEYINKGKDIRQVLCGHFTGRLLAVLLKTAGVAPYTKEDAYGSGIRRTAY